MGVVLVTTMMANEADGHRWLPCLSRLALVPFWTTPQRRTLRTRTPRRGGVQCAASLAVAAPNPICSPPDAWVRASRSDVVEVTGAIQSYVGEEDCDANMDLVLSCIQTASQCAACCRLRPHPRPHPTTLNLGRQDSHPLTPPPVQGPHRRHRRHQADGPRQAADAAAGVPHPPGRAQAVAGRVHAGCGCPPPPRLSCRRCTAKNSDVVSSALVG